MITHSNSSSKGRKIGLALSGGAVLGMAHLGVFKVLEEHNIPIHCIAGTSAGAMAGAFFAAGYSYEQIWRIAKDLNWGKIGGVTFPAKGLLNSRLLERFLCQKLGNINIEDLPIPFAATAVDLTTGKLIVYTTGPLARAVRASCIIPGVFTPLEIDDAVIVDGGLKSFLPLTEVEKLGADLTIAVKLVPSVKMRHKPDNIIEILTNTHDLTVAHFADISPHGDIEILPNLEGMNSYDFKQSKELVNRGAVAARKNIKKIKKALQKLPGKRQRLRRFLSPIS